MTSKFIALILFAGASAFAQTRWSITVGDSGYYAAPPAYYSESPYATPRYYGRGGAGYWGEDPGRRHRRAEWYGLRRHQEQERYLYGDSPELREHHAEERWELRREQWRERHGDYGAAYGPAHGSARDGLYHDDY